LRPPSFLRTANYTRRRASVNEAHLGAGCQVDGERSIRWEHLTIFGVYNNVTSFLLRFRWAVALAVLQGTIFAAIGESEHRHSMLYAQPPPRIEHFGCFDLSHGRLSDDFRKWAATVDCWVPYKIDFIVLTNFPVFAIWRAAAALTQNSDMDQVRLFYSINGVGIPALWFWVGSLIDRRRVKRRTDTTIRTARRR
jgi:hypothetical protein